MNDAMDENAFGLIEEALAKGNSVRVKVTGRSMKPFLNGGEIVVIEPAGSERVSLGDLVLFRDRQGQCVMHRVLWTGGGGAIRTKGDGLRSLDAPVRRNEILGRVSRIERSDGSAVDLRTSGRRRQSKRIALLGLARAALLKFARI